MGMKRIYIPKYSFHARIFLFCAFCIEYVFKVRKMNIVKFNKSMKAIVVVVTISD